MNPFTKANHQFLTQKNVQSKCLKKTKHLRSKELQKTTKQTPQPKTPKPKTK